MVGYKKTLFIGMIVTALGIVLSTTLGEKVGSLGIVFVAIGGLLFVIGMIRKKREDVDDSGRNQ